MIATGNIVMGFSLKQGPHFGHATLSILQGVKKVLDPPIIQNMAYSDRFKQKL